MPCRWDGDVSRFNINLYKSHILYIHVRIYIYTSQRERYTHIDTRYRYIVSVELCIPCWGRGAAGDGA